jgi:SAM-dependent methyltransferase
LARLDRERRAPQPGELAELAAWQGWGSLAPAYGSRRETDPRGWEVVRAAVERRVNAAQREAITARGVHTSYFTSPRIAEAVWRLATGLGFVGGKALDIGCGTGTFIATAPTAVPVEWTGIEPDPVTARIAALRFPRAAIAPRELQDVRLADGSYNLVIGNMPFGNPDTADYRRTNGLSLHNYCLWRALQAVRPGGLVIAITSRYTLDAISPAQRHRLAGLGELVGVIRLPSGVFSAAGTSVVTDLVAFVRHGERDAWRVEPRWEHAIDGIVPGLAVNEYFTQRRHLILGEPSVRKGVYRPTLAVAATGSITNALARATAELVRTAAAAAFVRRNLAVS